MNYTTKLHKLPATHKKEKLVIKKNQRHLKKKLDTKKKNITIYKIKKIKK